MKFTLCTDVHGVGFFWRVEDTEMHLLAINHKLSSEPSVPAFSNTDKTGAIAIAGKAAVLCIGGVRYITKVLDRIVGFAAVNVIDFLVRPFAVKMEPSNSVASVLPLVDDKAVVAVLSKAAGQGANFTAPAFLYSPSKSASFWIVIQNFAQSFSRQHLPSEKLGIT